MRDGADDDSASPFFYFPGQIAFSQSRPLKNSLSTVTTPENSKATVSPDKKSSK